MIRFGRTIRVRARHGRQALTLVAALAVTGLALPGAAGAATTCDVSVSTGSALDAAVASAANSGKTICVTANIAGSHTWSAKQSAMTTIVAQPSDMTIDMGRITFSGAKNLTVRGFEFTNGAFSVNCCSATTSVYMDGNYIHGFSGDGLDLYSQATMTDIQFTHNRVECLTGDGNGGNGYGIRTYGGPYDAPKFNYNTIKGCGNTGDGMEIGALRNFEVVGNVIQGIGGPANQHADALMIWSGSSNGLIKDNRILDGPGTLISPDGSDLVIENNLIARHTFSTGSDQCIDATPNGTSGQVAPTRWTMRRNTVWTCGNGGLNATGPMSSSHGANTLDHNLFTEVRCSTPSMFSTADYNLTGGGCSLSGTNQTNFSPTFADTVDYRPTNLPAGYETVGYRSAPAGFQAGGGTTPPPPPPPPPPPADTSAPDTTITSGPSGSTTATSASFAFDSTEAGSTFACKLDAGAYAACTSPKAYSGLAVGSHTMSVRATDPAGNTDPTPATRSWTVSAPSSAPTVTLTSPAANSTVGRTITFRATAASSAGIDRVEFWVDGSRVASDSSAPYGAKVTMRRMRSGTHTITARAFDRAGRSASSAVQVQYGGGAHAAAVRSARGAQVSTTMAGPNATRVAGSGAAHHTVTVTLTRCADAKGRAAARAELRADGRGRVAAVHARAGLCVLRIAPA